MTRGLPVLLVAALAACVQIPAHDQTQGSSATTAGNTGTGSSGGSTTGAATGSTTGSPEQDAGNCSLDRTSAQGDDCIPSFPCGCPFVCTDDPLETLIYFRVGTYVCEYPCTTNADCPTTDIACIGGACGAVPCGGGVGNGLFDSICAMGLVPDSGTCIPIALQVDGVDAGLCMQGGSATTSCNPLALDRAHLDEVCVPGFVCNGAPGVDGGQCLRACDDDDGCPAGEYCAKAALTPTYGVCLDAGL